MKLKVRNVFKSQKGSIGRLFVNIEFLLGFDNDVRHGHKMSYVKIIHNVFFIVSNVHLNVSP